MKQKKVETILYSTVGVLVMFLIIVAVNLITSAFKTRMDMTEEKAYTLDKGTKAILRKLDGPVEIRFYFSKAESRIPSRLKAYARQVEDLLGELQQASKGKVEIKKFDPEPDSEAEDLASLDGIEPQLMQTGERIYLGIAISQEPVKVALPFLSPDRDRLLEYDLARAISRVMSTNKPVIGVMTPLPMFGQPMNPMMRRMGQQQGQDPWVFISELKRDFEVKQVPMESEKIEDDIKVLLVAHPKDIKETAQYAIDQFIMRGGKLIAFLDAMSLADSRQQNPMMGMQPGGGSSLDKLLKAWGIQFETSKVAADMKFARELRGPNNQPQIVPTFLFLTAQGINKSDVVAGQLDEVLLPFAGVFSGTPVTGLKETVLLKTTTEAQLVDGMMAQMASQKIVDEFKPSGTAYSLAIRLNGKFKTAFPEGKPESKEPDKDAEKKDEAKKEEKKPDDSLKESKGENVVVLVGDSDFIYDPYCAQVQNFFGQKIVIPQFGNLNLAQNMVEQLAGDENLIGSRSRATLNRPFTVVKEMQAQATKQFQSEIKKLEEEQQEAQRRLNELNTKKEAGQRFILSKEQQAEIVQFKQKEAEAGKKLREVRKNLKREIDSLENRLKWLNIAGMPALVTIAGLALAIIRKRRTKAQ